MPASFTRRRIGRGGAAGISKKCCGREPDLRYIHIMDYSISSCAEINRIKSSRPRAERGRAARAAAGGSDGICGTIVSILFRRCFFAPENAARCDLGGENPAAD